MFDFLRRKKIQLLDIIMSVVLISTIAALANASEERLCMGISKPCIRDADCCNGCCFKEKCVSHSENCVKENNPCYLHECPPNTVCYLQKVQCIQAPCPPIPACRPLDYDYN